MMAFACGLAGLVAGYILGRLYRSDEEVIDTIHSTHWKRKADEYKAAWIEASERAARLERDLVKIANPQP